MEVQDQVKRALELIKNTEDSPIAKFIDFQPTDDITYLEMWFQYLEYSRMNRDLVKTFLDQIGWKVEDFEFQYHLTKAVHKLIDENLQQKLKKLSFTPRLEEYVQTYPKDEQENAKRLILFVLYKISKNDTTYDTLFELAEEYDIPKGLILSLNKHHQLFQDKIIELDNDSLNSEKSFLQREIVFNSTIYNIFANQQVNEEDLSMFKGSQLLSLFDLVDEDYFLNTVDDEQSEELFDDEDLDDDDDFNLDDLNELDDDEEEDDEPGMDEEEEEEVNEDTLPPYNDNLTYLFEEYKWMKMLSEMKDKQKDDLRYNEKENERAIHLLQQKIKKQKNICEIRLKKSKEKNFIPRLERLTARLKLSVFEKSIIKLLTATKIFLGDEDFVGSYSVDVKDIILLLIDDPIQQVQAKKYFLKNAKLLKTGILQVEQTDSLNQDIFNNDVDLDNRLVEYLIGENYDISDYIEGSFLYHSGIDINNVILPDEIKEKVLTTITNFPEFLKAKNHLQFSEVVEYGNALAMLFVGKSGTGKTMLANAISHHLGKKILLFNFNNLSQLNSMADERQVFSVLFREARMNDAILFFDESEAILETRINDLLIEIEKHEGIVIFATNAQFTIDEAMRRRINLIINIPDPGPVLRKDIWQIHLPEKMKLADDVDLDQLARRYELNGGLIKNAVFAALFQAVNETKEKEPVIKMEHLEYGAKDQLHNKLFMSNLERLKIPKNGVDTIILPETEKEKLREIINIEKSRKVLVGQWGFDDVFPDYNGAAVLFHGPSGTGKTITAEAIAYEMGKKLKIVNYSQVLSMYVGGTEKALEALFEEVADSDSILLFDEADALFASRTGVGSSTDRYANVETDVLLSLIERYNTFTILTTNYLDIIDKAFYRRMSYIVEFKAPSKDERVKLWEQLTPKKMPLHEDVSFEKLAGDFDFTGGDIKNAVIRAATQKAVLMQHDVQITQNDLETICKEISKTKNNGREKIGF